MARIFFLSVILPLLNVRPSDSQDVACLAALDRADRDNNGRVNEPEFINFVLDLSPYPNCPSLSDLGDFLSGGSFEIAFTNLSCLCLRYSSDSNCCTGTNKAIVLGEVYPPEYLERVCRTLSDSITDECVEDAPTSSPIDGILSLSPTARPTPLPTRSPTLSPTSRPTLTPTRTPSFSPTSKPTLTPTRSPSISPTNRPSLFPTKSPSFSPTQIPVAVPVSTTPPSVISSPTSLPTSSPIVNIFPDEVRSSSSDGPNRGLTIALPIFLGSAMILSLALLVRRKRQGQKPEQGYAEFEGSNHSDMDNIPLGKSTNEAVSPRMSQILDTIANDEEIGRDAVRSQPMAMELFETQSAASSNDGPSVSTASLKLEGLGLMTAGVSSIDSVSDSKSTDVENRGAGEYLDPPSSVESPTSSEESNGVENVSLASSIDDFDDDDVQVHGSSVLAGDITEPPLMSQSETDTDSSFDLQSSPVRGSFEPLEFGVTLETLEEGSEASPGSRPDSPTAAAEVIRDLGFILQHPDSE